MNNQVHRYSSLTEREAMFWAKVNKNGPIPSYRPKLGHCWIWNGYKANSGYGQFGWFGIIISSHIFSYCVLRGVPSAEHELDHLCRVKHCCNPWHLEEVTHKVNMERSVPSQRTKCPKGHKYAGKNLYMTPKGFRRCRRCRADQMQKRRDHFHMLYVMNKPRGESK